MDGSNILKIVMKKIFNLLLLLLLLLAMFGCSKEEDSIPIDPPTPPCQVDYSSLQTGINTKCSHYQPFVTPFTDYAKALNVNLPIYGSFSIWSAFGNFNGNDIPDYVMATGDWEDTSDNEVGIVIDGELVISFVNPQTQTRKVAVEDLNGDRIDDIVLFGTGPDIADSPGDETVVIYMYSNGNYQVKEIGTISGYHHNGAIGPIDGILPDIIEIDAQAFGRDPNGYVKYYSNETSTEIWTQKETNINNHYVARTYISELYDINKDGILDLFLGGHEWEESWMASSLQPVQWRTHILLGQGDGNFDVDNPIFLPIVEDWGVITEFDIYDIDNDQQSEIVVTRTKGKDGAQSGDWRYNYYDGIMVQVLEYDGSNWNESQRLTQTSLPSTHILWAYQTLIYDVNGDCLLDIIPESDKINAANFPTFNQVRGLYFEQQANGEFIKKYKR